VLLVSNTFIIPGNLNGDVATTLPDGVLSNLFFCLFGMGNMIGKINLTPQVLAFLFVAV
jgi:hypothetical protein